MNVTEMIRKLKMTKDDFFPLSKELGFSIGERAIKIDDRVAKKLMITIKKHQKNGKKVSLFADEKNVDQEEQDKKDEQDNEEKKVLEIPAKITVKNFADKLGKQVTDLIAILMKNGIMATINEDLDYETASIIAEDLGYKTELSEDTTEEEHHATQAKKIEEILDQERESGSKQSKNKIALEARPPVIVVMGHVDHGKTKLLDAVRETNVADQEAGGITQSIGAYQVVHKKRKITFVDTPGHEAFTAMRSRGANIADIAILVVAADDGVKPQTIEAIEIMEKTKLPFIVAINKIDKPGADIEKTKKDLSELNLIPEDWGGKTICVPISAKEKQNINELLDMVLLLADMDADKLTANPNRNAVGTIIESKIDKDSGPVATVLIQTGTLKVGDLVGVGKVSGKIKAMNNWKNSQVKEAGPAMPVRFLGLKGAPTVGDVLQVTKDRKTLKDKQKKYQSFGFLQAHKPKEDKNKKKPLKIILKGDTLGSLEAIVESLEKIKHDEVKIDIITKGLGSITEKDIDQAEAGQAVILGFNVELTPTGRDRSHGSPVIIETYKIIYELIDYVKENLEKLLTPDIIYNKIGALKVLAIFKSANKHTILGGKVIEGEIKDKAIIKLVRKDKQIGEGTIGQLQQDKKNVPKVSKKDTECGIQLKSETPAEVDDVIEVYEKEEKKKSLK